MKAARSSNGTFAPGTSGNPQGRPRMPEKLAERIRNLSTQAVDPLEKHLKSSDERLASDAAKTLLDRAWGKPVTPTDLKVDGDDLAGAHLRALQNMGRARPSAAPVTSPAVTHGEQLADAPPADAKAH